MYYLYKDGVFSGYTDSLEAPEGFEVRENMEPLVMPEITPAIFGLYTFKDTVQDEPDTTPKPTRRTRKSTGEGL